VRPSRANTVSKNSPSCPCYSDSNREQRVPTFSAQATRLSAGTQWRKCGGLVAGFLRSALISSGSVAGLLSCQGLVDLIEETPCAARVDHC